MVFEDGVRCNIAQPVKTLREELDSQSWKQRRQAHVSQSMADKSKIAHIPVARERSTYLVENFER
jgi:hypothetical protein